jgi:branched-chain amino acid aminotransferase
MIVYYDGRFVSEADASISIHDRGFLYGDGVFETALLHDGGFFRLRQHLERFIASAAVLRLRAPPLGEIDGAARTLVKRNGLTHAGLRFTLSRGVDHPVLLITAKPVDQAGDRRAAAGWRIVTATTRRPSPAAAPSQLKTLGRTYALLARIEAADAGADDALLLTDAGDVCEGPSWNVFWRTGRLLFTPALDAGVLAGITRAAISDLAATAGYDVREGLYPRSALDDADEIFATMTSAGLVSIRELDGRVLTAPTEAVDTLRPRYRRYLTDQAARDPA